MKSWLKRQFVFDYHGMNLDQFMAWQGQLYDLGISVSAVPSEYGQGYCINCRCIVNLGHHNYALEHAAEHQRACGGAQ